MLTVDEPDLERLASVITGRQRSVFHEAIAALDGDLREVFEGARVLITGGSGFIAEQTLRVLLPFVPAKVVSVDVNENGLAALVRNLRVEGSINPSTAFEPRLLDVTSPLVEALVRTDGPFDVVLAFAAAKHVRSERDPLSALHMVNVNVNGTRRVADAALTDNADCRLFVVSTDKAADPSSIMGASKRIMEMAVLGTHSAATAARFANVAFSSGSLLESWLIRMGRNELLPVPADTRRFFVSPAEAGQLCLIASLAPPGTIAIPAEGAVSSVELLDALERLIGSLGEQARLVSEFEKHGDRGSSPGVREVLVTRRDTAGEKPVEVFVGLGERTSSWVPAVDVIVARHDADAADAFAGWVTSLVSGGHAPTIGDLSARIAEAMGGFGHMASDLRLDDRI